MNYDIPTGIAAGQWLVMLLAIDGGTNTPSSTPTGFTALPTANPSSGGNGGAGGFAYYKTTTGSETNSSFTLSGAEKYVCYTLLFTDTDVATPPEATTASGSSSSADAPSRTASWGARDNVFLSWIVTSDSLTAWGAPSGYTEIYNNDTGGTTTGVQTNICFKNSSAATDNPAAVTLSASVAWGATTIVLPSVAVGSGVPDLPPTQEGSGVLPQFAVGRQRRYPSRHGYSVLPQLSSWDEQVTLDRFAPVYDTVLRKHQRRPPGCFAYTEVPVLADVVVHGWDFFDQHMQLRWNRWVRDNHWSRLITGVSVTVPPVIDPISLSYITVVGESKIVPKYFGLSGVRPKYAGESSTNAEGE